MNNVQILISKFINTDINELTLDYTINLELAQALYSKDYVRLQNFYDTHDIIDLMILGELELAQLKIDGK